MDVYTENIRMVLLIAGLKMEGIVKWRGLKSQGPLHKTIVSFSIIERYSSWWPQW